MLRRVPPPLLALTATVLLLGVVVGLYLAFGGRGSDRPVGTCTTALERGPYGCVVFVSVSGSEAGRDAEEPVGGAITIRIVKRTDGFGIVYSVGCSTTDGQVEVTADRWVISGLRTTLAGCDADRQRRDDWAAALLTGTVRVVDRDDATVELVHGDRRALFAQVVAPRG